MAKSKANVRTIQLGNERPESSGPPISRVENMPVRPQYTEAELKPKQHRYYISFCTEDASDFAEEFNRTKVKFIAEKQRQGNSVATSEDGLSSIESSTRDVVFLTSDYLASRSCVAELRSILLQLPLLHGLLILRDPKMVSSLRKTYPNGLGSVFGAVIDNNDFETTEGVVTPELDHVLKVIASPSENAQVEQLVVTTLSNGLVEKMFSKIDET
jgi:hypothetical protein